MDKATVLKVAKLARIKIEDNKIDHYVQEISNIEEVIKELNTAGVEGLEPLVNVSESKLSQRKDEVTDGSCAEEILKNAPQQKFDYFVVPKVIE